MQASLSIDLLWLLLCTALVFFMQAGFACLESGLTRRKNSINVALKKIAGFSITGTTFWFFGFGMVFGSYSWHGFIGWANDDFSSSNVQLISTYLYELMFAGCAITIISGAIAERVKFSGYLIMVLVMATLVYPFVGHWSWNNTLPGNPGGWLSNLGFMDFAGSTVVHSSGGWAALACAIVLGPRIGRFGEDGKPVEISGNDVPLSILGALILWFGWIGFNGGSALKFVDRVPMILLCTMLAPIFGLLSALLVDWYRKGYARVDAAINGALGGLVAVTAGSNVLEPHGAICVGLIAGVLVLWSEELILKAKWDDAVGAFPVHGVCGVFGTLAVALFGDPALFGGRTVLHQFSIQLLGAICVFVWTMTTMYVVLKIIDTFFFKLRVSPEDEVSGLNIVEHHATTEILDLFYAMEKQAATGDLTLRVHEEPFTEAGQIARRYNKVLDRVNIEIEIVNRMAKLIDEARKEADKANNAKSIFLASMSHGFRTPMNGVLGMLEICLGTKLTKEQKDYLETAHASGVVLMSLLNDILDYSKIEAGKLEIENTEFDFYRVIHDIAHLFRQKINEKGLELVVSIDPSIPHKLIGDSTRIRQIISNIIGNSVKFTAEGYIAIKAVNKKTEEGEKLDIQVTDTGCGMSQLELDNLFKPFTQADASITRKYGGTGLGLTISKRLVELLGGRIWVESEQGKGTTFFIELPLVFKDGTCYPFNANRETEDSDRFTRIAANIDKNIHVLIAEDNAVNQKVIKAYFDKLGFKNVQIVDNGLQALEAIELKQFDIVFMDIQMPVMDGLVATMKIRTNEMLTHTHLPIVALTAHSFVGDKKRCFDAGVDDYLGKPIQLDRLISCLEKWTHHKKADTHEIEVGTTEGVVAIEPETPEREIDIDYSFFNLTKGALGNSFPDMVVAFINDGLEKIQQIEASIHNDNKKAVSFSAHQLKSSSASFGIRRLSEISKQLDELAKSSAYTKEAAAAIFKELASEFKKATLFLERQR